MSTQVINVPDGTRHAIAADSSRYAINGAEVRSDGNGAAFITATDGRVLAVRRAEGEVGAAGPFVIPGSMLPRRKAGDVITNTDGKLHGLRSKLTDEPIASTFPPCADVIPDVAATAKGGAVKYDRVLTLSAQLLFNLAKAITDGKANDTLRVSLLLPVDPCKPIAVLPSGDDHTDSLGVLMPATGVERQGFVELYATRRDTYQAAVKGGAE